LGGDDKGKVLTDGQEGDQGAGCVGNEARQEKRLVFARNAPSLEIKSERVVGRKARASDP